MPDTQHTDSVSQLKSQEFSSEDIRAALAIVLSSRSFHQSARMKRFLTYLVEETLAGRAEHLKEYTIALEVFDRDQSFDPQTSSLVRVEAGRLRAKLSEYQHSLGPGDTLSIELPRGSYVPKFTNRDVEDRKIKTIVSAQADWKRHRAPALPLLAIGTAILAIAAVATSMLVSLPKKDMPPATARASVSVAVYPFHNLTGDPAEDYLADGMTDAIINRLARSHRLRVISFTSVMQLKNASTSIGEIGSLLGVQHVIEGSVTRSRDRIRISAKLIDASSNQHIWVETFERPALEMFEMQDDVAGKIKTSLFGSLVAQENETLSSRPPISADAYEAYLRGRFFSNQISASGFKKAIGYFQQVISKAPSYAPAHADLAACYCLLGGHGLEIIRPDLGMPQAKRAAQEALRLDETLAEPYAYLGIIQLKYDWDWAGAERSLKRAIELKPNFYRAKLFYSYYLEAMGRSDEAIREAESARAIAPLSRAAIVNLGWQFLQAGMSKRAQTQFESALELEPDFWAAHWGLGHLYRRQGKLEKSIASFETAVAAGGGHVLPLSALGHAYAISGRRNDAVKVLRKLATMEETTYVSPFNMATIYVGLGETNMALEQLERAYSSRSRSLVWLNVMPEYDPIRREPKFLELVHRIGLPLLNR